VVRGVGFGDELDDVELDDDGESPDFSAGLGNIMTVGVGWLRFAALAVMAVSSSGAQPVCLHASFGQFASSSDYVLFLLILSACQ
jgi:hypothetical protein